MTMFSTVKSILYNIAFNSDMIGTRLTLIMGSFLWSIFLFWPGDLFSPARQTYHIMSEIASENVWGTLFLIQALFASYTLLTNVRNKVTLTMDSMLGCTLWTSSTLACFMSHFVSWSSYQPPAAMSAEVILTVASWWHLVRYWAQEEKNG